MMPSVHRPCVLCVDDEPQILAGLVNTLRRRFDVTTAEGGQAALRLLGGSESFDVIVSDFMMPVMNGAEFLAIAKVAAPDAVRILLTGQASMENAIDVVNQGNVFRFLTKPCSPDDLMRALDDAVEQARLQTADNALVGRKLQAMSQQLLRAERLASTGTLAGAIGQELSSVADELVAASEPIERAAAAGLVPSPESLELLRRTRNRLVLHAQSLLALGKTAVRPDQMAADLGRAVTDVLHMLLGAGLLRDVRVRLDLPAASQWVHIEGSALQRVLLNVIKNAVEAATSERGDGEAPALSVEVSASEGKVACTVSDNGPGIQPGHLPLIFEPYFTTKAPDDGAGLGLFAVQQIMREAGGEVSVDSRPGRGTAFTVRLAPAAGRVRPAGVCAVEA